MAKEVLDTIVNVQPKDSSTGSGETRENIVYHIADDMLSKLPPAYVPHEVPDSCLGMQCTTNCVLSGQSKATKDGCTFIDEHFPAPGD